MADSIPGSLTAAYEDNNVYDEEMRLANRAIRAGSERAAAARGLMPALQEQTTAGQGLLRQQAAQALSSSLGQAGGVPVGGGLGASMRQTALQRGLAGAQFGAEQAVRMNQARQEAALAAQEAALGEQAIRGAQATRQQQEFLSAYQSLQDMQAAGYKPASIAWRLDIMAENAIDPQAAARIRALAAQIRGGQSAYDARNRPWYEDLAAYGEDALNMGRLLGLVGNTEGAVSAAGGLTGIATQKDRT